MQNTKVSKTRTLGESCGLSLECVGGYVCYQNVCKVPTGGPCATSLDCISTNICNNNVCVASAGTIGQPCTASQPCLSPLICQSSVCKAPSGTPCSNSSQCITGLVCNNGVCSSNPVNPSGTFNSINPSGTFNSINPSGTSNSINPSGRGGIRCDYESQCPPGYICDQTCQLTSPMNGSTVPNHLCSGSMENIHSGVIMYNTLIASFGDTDAIDVVEFRDTTYILLSSGQLAKVNVGIGGRTVPRYCNNFVDASGYSYSQNIQLRGITVFQLDFDSIIGTYLIGVANDGYVYYLSNSTSSSFTWRRLPIEGGAFHISTTLNYKRLLVQRYLMNNVSTMSSGTLYRSNLSVSEGYPKTISGIRVFGANQELFLDIDKNRSVVSTSTNTTVQNVSSAALLNDPPANTMITVPVGESDNYLLVKSTEHNYYYIVRNICVPMCQ